MSIHSKLTQHGLIASAVIGSFVVGVLPSSVANAMVPIIHVADKKPETAGAKLAPEAPCSLQAIQRMTVTKATRVTRVTRVTKAMKAPAAATTETKGNEEAATAAAVPTAAMTETKVMRAAAPTVQ